MEPLASALELQWHAQDGVACITASVLQAVLFFRASVFTERLVEGCLIATELTLWSMARRRPPLSRAARLRHLRLRTLLVVLLRMAIMAVAPSAVDHLRILQPAVVAQNGGSGGAAANGAAAAAAAAAAAGRSPLLRAMGLGGGRLTAFGMLASLGAHVRAVILLLVPVCYLHGSVGTALGWQLPPLLHVAVHAAGSAALLLRAPKICSHFVARHPANANVASAIFWLFRQVTSLLCPGTREHLAAVAAAKTPCHKCAAVVWALQLSLGFVLPTLMIWRAQLDAARRHASEQRDLLEQIWLIEEQHRRAARRSPRPGRWAQPRPRRRWQEDVGGEEAGPAELRTEPGRSGWLEEADGRGEQAEEEEAELREAARLLGEADRELACSQFVGLCQPVLETAALLRWWAVVGISMVLAFVAALLQQAARPGASPCLF